MPTFSSSLRSVKSFLALILSFLASALIPYDLAPSDLPTAQLLCPIDINKRITANPNKIKAPHVARKADINIIHPSHCKTGVAKRVIKVIPVSVAIIGPLLLSSLKMGVFFNNTYNIPKTRANAESNMAKLVY